MKGYWALVTVRSQVRYMGSSWRDGGAVAGVRAIGAGDDEPSKDPGGSSVTFF